MKIRNCEVRDIERVRRFISQNPPIVAHRPPIYWVLFTYFNNSYFLAEEDSTVIGFAGGLKNTSQEGVFHLWQIGVDKKYRRQGYANKLLNTVINEVLKMGCTKLQIAILPENTASYTLFNKFAENHNKKMLRLSLIDYYDGLDNFKENEVLYEIDLRNISLND